MERTGPTQSLHEDAPPLEAVRVTAISGPAKGAQATLDAGTLVVGSSGRCGLTLRDPAVSARHASLELVQGGVRVRDLGSKNGLRFLGAKVDTALLPLGSTLALGHTVLSLAPVLEQHVSEKTELAGLVARSLAMRQLLWRVERAAASDATVVVRGPTGAGKEAVARALHALSPRARGPFIAFDCAGARGELLESELFGHLKGAFTGAAAARAGLVEQAHGGTLLLDNVDQLPVELQPKLLRFLEERTVRRVGASREVGVDVRVMATTARSLEEAVEAGQLRSDVYFRLSAVVLDVPPLSQRLDDIPVLAARFAEEVAGLPVTLSKATVAALQAHPWPGNARELKNAVARSLAFGRIDAPAQASAAAKVDEAGLKRAREQVVSAFEADYLRALLERHRWNVAAVAREAKLARSHLYTLIGRYQLKRR
ncbi:MAG: sigma 54-interacting transcriptional regulator [Myxococcota bacterium]